MVLPLWIKNAPARWTPPVDLLQPSQAATDEDNKSAADDGEGGGGEDGEEPAHNKIDHAISASEARRLARIELKKKQAEEKKNRLIDRMCSAPVVSSYRVREVKKLDRDLTGYEVRAADRLIAEMVKRGEFSRSPSTVNHAPTSPTHPPAAHDRHIGGNAFKIFKACDPDDSGSVEFFELRYFARKELRMPVTRKELELVWHALDSDGDGAINMVEFTKTVTVACARHARRLAKQHEQEIETALGEIAAHPPVQAAVAAAGGV